MATTEFTDLELAVAALKAGLMNYGPRLDGNYTPEELMKCQAFVVFSHAEIENYLEKIARRIMREAKARWDQSAMPDRVIASLLMYRRSELTGPPEDIRNPTKKHKIKEVVTDAMKVQGEAIDDNNGIKTSNLSKLLAPLGVSDQEVDEALLIQLSNVGSRRGDFVHKQSKVSLRNLRDPFADEVGDIALLLGELGRFDAKLETIGLLSPQPVSASTPAPAAIAQPQAAAGGSNP